MMRSAALYGALFVASAQGFQPTTSFHGRAFSPKAMSTRFATGVVVICFVASLLGFMPLDPGLRSSGARCPTKAMPSLRRDILHLIVQIVPLFSAVSGEQPSWRFRSSLLKAACRRLRPAM